MSAFKPGKPPLWPPSIYVPKPGVIPGGHGGDPMLAMGPFAHFAAQMLTATATKNNFCNNPR